MPAKTNTRPLTPLMVAALQTATPRRGHEDVLEISSITSGATAKGLRERGLITLDCALTPAGLQVHAKTNPAPAVEPAPEPEADTECPRCGGPLASDGVCADDSCGDEDEAPTETRIPLDVVAIPAPRMSLALKVDARPALASLAQALSGIGHTVGIIGARMALSRAEAGVRLARTIPDGRQRHGQIKARRDALRHARKLELARL
jgi:hypothetical protein